MRTISRQYSVFRKSVQKYFKNSPVIYGVLAKIDVYIQEFQKKILLKMLEGKIIRLLGPKRAVFFVQIGSNDGVQGDPLCDLIIKNKHWGGIFIEPVKFLFDRLRQNHKNEERFVFENVAISENREKKEFYYVSEEARTLFNGQLPSWCDGLGSFDKQHIIRHFNGRLEPYIVSQKIECATLGDILLKNKVSRIDIIDIDTEGHDFKVLCQIDFDKYKPVIIIYEHVHLSAAEKQNAEYLLRQNGYSLAEYGEDTLAVSTLR